MCRTRHKTCNQCVRDPYCGWDPEQQECRPYSTGKLTGNTHLHRGRIIGRILLYNQLSFTSRIHSRRRWPDAVRLRSFAEAPRDPRFLGRDPPPGYLRRPPEAPPGPATSMETQRSRGHDGTPEVPHLGRRPGTITSIRPSHTSFDPVIDLAIQLSLWMRSTLNYVLPKSVCQSSRLSWVPTSEMPVAMSSP